MNFLKKTLVLGSVLAAFSVGSALAADDKSPIKIVTNNWTSQLVLANVVGQLLQQMGYNVEYKSSDTQLQFTAIAAGDMDFQVEVWEGSMGESFNKAMAEGAVDLAIDAVGLQEYDLAAVMVVVEEAGGTFTDRHGARTFSSDTAISSNGRLHEHAKMLA